MSPGHNEDLTSRSLFTQPFRNTEQVCAGARAWHPPRTCEGLQHFPDGRCGLSAVGPWRALLQLLRFTLGKAGCDLTWRQEIRLAMTGETGGEVAGLSPHPMYRRPACRRVNTHHRQDVNKGSLVNRTQRPWLRSVLKGSPSVRGAEGRAEHLSRRSQVSDPPSNAREGPRLCGLISSGDGRAPRRRKSYRREQSDPTASHHSRHVHFLKL